MKKQAEEWLVYAYYDLLTIVELIDNEQLTTPIAFHAQQCVEKSFKALLALTDVRIPRIHDLRKLLKTVSQTKIVLTVDEDLIDQLSQVYIDTRYPADFGLIPEGKPSHEKVKDFYEMAENIYEQVDAVVNPGDR